MKPIVETLAYPAVGSIRYGQYELVDFEYPFHIHPEYEFTWMIDGAGRQVIGDDVSRYSSGELVFIGPNLPHSWLLDYDKKMEHRVFHLVNLQFRDDSLGGDFFSHSEMAKIRHLLDVFRNGLVIHGQTRRIITEHLRRIVGQKEFDVVLGMLEILHILSKSEEYRVCSLLGYIPGSPTQHEMERIRQIHQYVMDNYIRGIDLQEISSMLGLTCSAFCHFFKKRTGRPFIRYVNEIRIRHACKLLQETSLSITEVCYESGFNNLSFFNRVFLRIMNQNPSRFRRQQPGG